jgi:hypothetical protein
LKLFASAKEFLDFEEGNYVNLSQIPERISVNKFFTEVCISLSMGRAKVRW